MNKHRREVAKLVKLIMGLKGSGKTKSLVELIRIARDEETGDIVCLEKGERLRYDLPYTVRLVETSQHEFLGYYFLKGFISGMYSANFDITHFFIDSVLRIIGVPYDEKADDFLEWCENFAKTNNVKFTITITADVNLASDKIKKYF